MRTFAAFMGLIALGLAAIAAFTYPAWLLLHPHFDFPFHRIGERIGMAALLAGLVLAARRLRLNDAASLGYGAARGPFLRRLAGGLGIGVVSMAAVVGLMSALGLLDWSPATAFTPAALAKLVCLRLSSGLAVALIEETLLRGAMYTGIERESGTAAAVLLTAVIYAASHFFASYRIAPEHVTASSGVQLLLGTLHTFAAPAAIADAFLCLLAVGIVLGVIRAATGTIAAGIGLHAGWVWVMLVVHSLAQARRAAHLSFLLSRFDGFVGWLVLAWTIPLGFGLWRFYSAGSGVTGASNSRR